MMQGDGYFLRIRLENNAGSPVTPADVSEVEISVGQLTKTYSAGQLRYYDGAWLFPVCQQESFRLRPGAVRCAVRVAWAGGAVEGKPLYGLRVEESVSREVLQV